MAPGGGPGGNVPPELDPGGGPVGNAEPEVEPGAPPPNGCVPPELDPYEALPNNPCAPAVPCPDVLPPNNEPAKGAGNGDRGGAAAAPLLDARPAVEAPRLDPPNVEPKDGMPPEVANENPVGGIPPIALEGLPNCAPVVPNGEPTLAAVESGLP